MRLADDAIPSTFVRLDESTVEADRFVDVRTQQQLRTNHNALLARGHMRPVFVDKMQFAVTNMAGIGINTPREMPPIYSVSVLLSPFVRKLRARVQAKVVNATSMGIYAGLAISGMDARALVGTTTSSTSYGWHTFDLTVPHLQLSHGAWQRVTFGLYTTILATGATILGAPAAITSLEERSNRVYSVTCSGGGLGLITAGDVLYSASTATVEPKVCWAVNSAGTRAYVPPTIPWEAEAPVVGDTLQALHGNYLTLTDVQLYEYPRSGNLSDLEYTI